MAKESLSAHLESLRIHNSQREDSGRGLPRWLWVVIVILIVAIGGWAAANALRSPEVEVARVVRMELRGGGATSVLVASGYVVAHHKISLSSKVMGKVAWVGVEKGDIVKRDQVLVRLEDPEYKAN